MKYRKTLASVAAATLVAGLSFNVLAQEAVDPGPTGANPTGTAGQSGAAGQTGPGQSGSMKGQAGATAGQAGGDMQVEQALRQISQSPEQAPDKLFVLMAALGNAWEVEFARVVEQKVQDAQVKQLARQIQQDHQQAQQQLRQLAQAMNLQLPTSLPSAKQQKLQIFQAMSPEQLQTCFIVDLRADHAKAITSYSDHRQTLQNEQVKQYIAQALPKLQQHGSQVMQLASSKQIGDSSIMIGNTDQQQNREVQRRGEGSNATGSGTGTSGASGAGSSSGGTGSGSSPDRTGTGASDNPTGAGSGTGSSPR